MGSPYATAPNCRKREKKRGKERKREKTREKREKTRKKRNKKREKGERKERKGEKNMFRVNFYQSAFNSQKEKLNILAEMLKISKSGFACGSIYNRPPPL